MRHSSVSLRNLIGTNHCYLYEIYPARWPKIVEEGKKGAIR